MQINSVVNSQIIQRQQNFKGSSVTSSPFTDFPTYQQISLNTSKAYVLPQIANRYREIETFDVPYVGKGKLYELANGHKVAIVPKSGPFIINTCVKVGQDNDPVISHFVEHLVYNFDTPIENETFAAFQRKLGIDGNATTHSDYTNYYMKYPFDDKETIDKIIKVQAQILQQPKDFKTQYEKEKGILISEATIRAEDKSNPDENILRYLIINKLLGLDEKPKPGINEVEKIKNTNLEELENFYKKYYNNNNMITFIVGNVNPDETVKTIAQNFNKLNNINGAKLADKKQDISKPIEQTKRLDVVLDSKINKNVQVGFVGPQNNDIKNSFLSLALKFYIQEIKNNTNLTYNDINTETLPAKNSVIIFSAESESGQEKLILNNINLYVSDLVKKPISDKDLEALKIKLQERFTSFNESAYVMSLIGGEKLLYSNKIDFFEYSKLIYNLTKEDLQNFAKKYFDLNKSVLVVTKEKLKVTNQTQPSFGSSKTSLDTSNITEYQYPDTNLQLTVDTSPSIAKTSFRFGLVSDKIPNIKPGVAKIFSFMLLGNLENYKSEYPYISEPQLKVKLNELSLLTSCPPDYTQKTIELIKSSILNPKLTQKSLDDTKNFLKDFYKLTYTKTKQDIQQQKYANYNYLDSSIECYSPDEYCKIIDAITLDDIIDFQKQLASMSQGKAILVMPKNSFDLQKKELFNLIGKNVPRLQPKQKIDLTNEIPVEPISTSKIIIDKIDNNNAVIQQDFKIPMNGDLKEALSIKLINIMLGEQANSRLVDEIRQKQGLSYSTGALFDSDGRLGYLSLISNSPLGKNDASNLQKVLDTFKKNTSDLINNSISNQELEIAKTIFKSQIIQQLEYSSRRNDLIYEYGLDGTSKLFQTLEDITSNDIQNIAKKTFSKPSIIIIKANNDVVEQNKAYLDTIGEVV